MDEKKELEEILKEDLEEQKKIFEKYYSGDNINNFSMDGPDVAEIKKLNKITMKKFEQVREKYKKIDK